MAPADMRGYKDDEQDREREANRMASSAVAGKHMLTERISPVPHRP